MINDELFIMMMMMMMMIQEKETVTMMISAPVYWSAGQTIAPPRLEDIGTRVTIVVRRDVPETDNVVLIKVPAPPTLTV